MALDANQRRAIELLVEGRTQVDTAKTVGIDRSTLVRWVNKHDDFRAELAAAMEDITAEARTALRGSVARAAYKLSELIDSDDPKVARAVCIDILDRAGVVAPKGDADVRDRPLTADEMRDAHELIAKMKSKANE